MKAKEYFDKYKDGIWEEYQQNEPPLDGAIAHMYIEMVNEIKTIGEQRRARFNRAYISIIDEQNAKWNSVCNMFINKYGESPLTRDGFKKAVKKELELT